MFVAIYLIPLGILLLLGAVAKFTGNSFHFDAGPHPLVLLPVLAALATPRVSLVLSTARMKREAESFAFETPES